MSITLCFTLYSTAIHYVTAASSSSSSSTSFIQALPKELIHKISNDYASNQDLKRISQICNKWRRIVHGIELIRIEEDYAELINNGRMNATDIFKKFYHLRERKTWKELGNGRMPYMFRGILNCGCHQQGHFPYLAFSMREIYMQVLYDEYYKPLNGVQIKTIFYVFRKGRIHSFFYVDNPYQTKVNLNGTAACPDGKWIKTMQSIMNGHVMLCEDRKLILLNKAGASCTVL